MSPGKPTTPRGASHTLETALAWMDAGRFHEAETLLGQLASRHPRDPNPRHALGLLCHQTDRHAESVSHLRRALQLAPGDPDLWIALSFPLHALGQSREAASCYEKVLARRPDFVEGWFNLGLIQRSLGENGVAALERTLALRPDHAQAHNSLGNALQEQGRHAEALDHFQQAIALKPDLAEGWHNLGLAKKARGDAGAAREALEQAVRLAPRHPGLVTNLGLLHLEQGREQEAEACCQEALRLQPDFPEALYVLGLLWIKRGENGRAIALLRQAATLQPTLADAQLMLGNLLVGEGDNDAGMACFHRLLERVPGHAIAHGNLANLLLEQWRESEAEEHYRLSLHHNPNLHDALFNMGLFRKSQQNYDDALLLLQKALALKPDHTATLHALHEIHQILCDYPRMEALQDKLAALLRQELFPDSDASAAPMAFPELLRQLCDPRASSRLSGERMDRAREKLVAHLTPFALLSLSDSAVVQKEATRIWARHQFEQTAARAPHRPHPPPPAPGEPIRVGYLSANFNEHATSFLVTEIMENHDRQKFEIHLYSYSPDDGGPMRTRLQRACHRFHEMRPFSYARMAEEIRADQVEILVDLMGYTHLARPRVMALQPAPIQVQWLGYPGTLGVPWIDYILADPHVIPRGAESHYSEQVIRLPHCYQPNDRQRPWAPPPPRAAVGLPEGGMVYASLNQSYKITRELFSDWMAILEQTPGSVLWLLACHPLGMENLRRQAALHGVDPKRLVFAPHLPLADHLRRLGAADLFLDTFPYNGHTTASDALWAGVPVLTRPGDTFASRVATSLAWAAGVPEGIVPDREHYRALAVELGRDPGKRTALREKVLANRETCPLFDSLRFTRHLEEAYQRIVQRRRQGLPCQGIDLSPDGES